MYRIWLLVDPRRALIGLTAWLGFLALLLHFIMLSTDRFNWIEGPRAARVKAAEIVPAPAPAALLGVTIG
jgi:light-harvesting complex 1 alpha chain